MKKEDFYAIFGSFKQGEVRLASQAHSDPSTTALINRLQLEDSLFLSDNRCTHYIGKRWYDFITFYDSRAIEIISHRIVELFKANAVTGCGYIELDIEGFSDKRYYVLQPLSQAGKLLNDMDDEIDSGSNPRFDLSTWDGSDVFHLKDTWMLMCTPRVHELLVKAKATNVRFEVCHGVDLKG